MDIIVSSTFWLALAFFILIIFILFGGFSYINCKDAFKGYIELFKVEDRNLKKRIIKRNLLFFLFFPFVLATSCNFNQIIQTRIIDVICVVTSIMTAMLFSFMAVISSKYENVCSNNKISNSTYEDVKVINEETTNIVTCEILISVFLLILCFTQPLVEKIDFVFFSYKQFYCSIISSLSWLVYYCFFFFVLNLLIVTKRFYRISSKNTTV